MSSPRPIASGREQLSRIASGRSSSTATLASPSASPERSLVPSSSSTLKETQARRPAARIARAAARASRTEDMVSARSTSQAGPWSATIRS